MNDLIIKDNIGNMIYEVKGKYAILDSDLAKLLEVETKRINETVKNNKMKFYEYVFELTKNEYEIFSRSIRSTLKNNFRGQNIKYPHKAFTRDGVAILGSIMRGEK